MAAKQNVATELEVQHPQLDVLIAKLSTEKFSRKMKLVQDIESAMEESFDQDIETVYPPAADATYVSRSAAELSSRHGPTAVLNLPLRKAGKAIATLTLERPVDQPFALEEVETLRLTCDLCIARLENLHRHDRWFGARMAGAARKGSCRHIRPISIR